MGVDPFTAAIGGGIALFGSLTSGQAQSRAVNRSARAQTEAARTAAASQEKIFERQAALQEPFRQLGVTGADILSRELKTPLEATEGFRFREEEANRALNRQLAAKGLFNSGASIRAGLGLNQRLVTEAQNRRDQLLSSALGIGQRATGIQGQALGTLGQSQLGLNQRQGSIESQRVLAQGRGEASLFSSLTGLGLQGLGLFGTTGGFSGAGPSLSGAGIPINPRSAGGIA